MSEGLTRPPVDLSEITSAFCLHGKFIDGASHGNGHINDTYAVRFDQAGTPVRYILQRINERVFPNVPALMENVQRVAAHATARAQATAGDDATRRALTLIPTREGNWFHRDVLGGFWRCSLFIEKAKTYDQVENPRQAFAAARAFGEFQRLMVDLPGARLHETISNFHHTRSRFEALKRVMATDSHRRAAQAMAELDFAFTRESIVDVVLNLHAQREIPERVTHNDAKFNNVMLDDATDEGVCVIDLDTVMPGFSLYDFGDLVRSATNSAAEDESDLTKVNMRMPIYEGLVSGYIASAGHFLCAGERAHLAFAGKLITFEIGLRFLTDYLEGDVYFKVKRAAHNLDRCRNQFALVRSIEEQESAMRLLTDRILREV